jgi:hypothetical protein
MYEIEIMNGQEVSLEEEELKAQAEGRKHSDYYYLMLALGTK